MSGGILALAAYFVIAGAVFLVGVALWPRSVHWRPPAPGPALPPGEHTLYVSAHAGMRQ